MIFRQNMNIFYKKRFIKNDKSLQILPEISFKVNPHQLFHYSHQFPQISSLSHHQFNFKLTIYENDIIYLPMSNTFAFVALIRWLWSSSLSSWIRTIIPSPIRSAVFSCRLNRDNSIKKFFVIHVIDSFSSRSWIFIFLLTIL